MTLSMCHGQQRVDQPEERLRKEELQQEETDGGVSRDMVKTWAFSSRIMLSFYTLLLLLLLSESEELRNSFFCRSPKD